MFFALMFLLGLMFRVFLDHLGVEFLSNNSIIANSFMLVSFIAGYFFRGYNETKNNSRSSFPGD